MREMPDTLTYTEDMPDSLTYKEMRAVAQRIYENQRKARLFRSGLIALVCGLLGMLVLMGVFYMIFVGFHDTEVKSSDGKDRLVVKDTDLVIATSESTEDIDGSDLLDYARNEVDSNGDPDGDWVLSEANIALARTISWYENDTMHVHHVGDIVRHNGNDARVEIITKAGHVITVWDSDGVDTFDVTIQRRDQSTGSLGPVSDVNPDGDQDERGRGRVVVSLRRPSLADKAPQIHLNDYF